MKDVILRGLYGTLWSYPAFKLLYWLEDVKLAIIFPWETAIILTLWMMVGWGVYALLGKAARLIMWRAGASRALKKRGKYGL